jgi:aspartyl-tRNA(Asn)/glutamyl-tRNA(Gln) amidotransferase subunit A
LCYGSFGSDTGGSIRIPASLCGVVGLKPTYGRASTRGVIPLSFSLDHVGPMARSVSDVAVLFQAIAGHDPDDPFSIDVPTEDYSAHLVEGVRGWRIALAVYDSDPEVAEAVMQAARVFEQLGAYVEEVSVPPVHEGRQVSRMILNGDAAAYHQERLKAHPDYFGADLMPRLQSGLNATAIDYAQARRMQARLRRQMEQFFERFDALLTPATPIPAAQIDDPVAVEKARADLSQFTAVMNVVGVPAISVPCGFTSPKLPIGLQIAAGHWAEAKLLRAAYAYEQATDWHLRKPQI